MKLLVRLQRIFLFLICLAALLCTCSGSTGLERKRLVVLRFDGLAPYFIDDLIDKTDPETRKPFLPWIKHIFYDGGVRLNRFYTRGLSLSGSSWTALGTGQDLIVKSNVEFDRATSRVEDYLNITRFYYDYTRKSKKLDSRAVEVLDEAKVLLASDAYDDKERYLAGSMFQRGIHWGELLRPLKEKFTTRPANLVGDVLLGFDWHEHYLDSWERTMIEKIEHTDTLYLDYYNPICDETFHGDRTKETTERVLKSIDAFVGRVFTSIQKSPRAKDTVLVVVSDHGFNRDEAEYSQGYNLGQYLLTRSFGAHHLLTKRFILSAYAYRSTFTPFASEAITESKNSYYLKGRGDYVTAALDYDGNERTALLLRNADWNKQHMLWLALRNPRINADLRGTLTEKFFATVDAARPQWVRELQGLEEEIAAMERRAKERREEYRRAKGAKDVRLWRKPLADASNLEEYASSYRRYARALQNLIGIDRASFHFTNARIEDYIPPRSFGPPNRAGDLLDYPVALRPDGSFQTINYPEFLTSQRVRNNVQQGVSAAPVDFVAHRIPCEEIADTLRTENIDIRRDVVWLYGDREHQALLLLQQTQGDVRRLRYLPIRNLRSTREQTVTFDRAPFGAGFPLHLYEDQNLKAGSDRGSWLGEFHTEAEWRAALAATQYSLSVTGLYALFERPNRYYESAMSGSADDRLIERFYLRSRNHTEPDLHILATDGWNFDVKGFNPGGNHGALFQKSMRSVLMIWGGEHTGVARGRLVDEPFDSLSYLPTVFEAAELIDGGKLTPRLIERGFRPFPGDIIWQAFRNSAQPVGENASPKR